MSDTMPAGDPPTWRELAGSPPFQEAFERVANRVSKERASAENALTELQFIEAMKQALASGDFMRHVRLDNGGQCITYEPFRERENLMARIAELEQRLEDAGLPLKENPPNA